MAVATRNPLDNKLDYQIAALKLRREGLTWSKIAEQLGTTSAEVRELADFSRLSFDEIALQLEEIYRRILFGTIPVAQGKVLLRAYKDAMKQFDPRTGNRKSQKLIDGLKAAAKGE